MYLKGSELENVYVCVSIAHTIKASVAKYLIDGGIGMGKRTQI